MSFLTALRTWGEMIKFSHSVFALPFAFVAAALAGATLPAGRPAAPQIALILWCMVAARSFAMTCNRIADAAIDARNPRTAARPIPAGRITPRQSLAFLLACAAAFIAGCAAFLADRNPWPLALSLPVLACLAAYSYTKRFTALSHFALGAAIAAAPLAAWIAVNPRTVGAPALLLAAAVAAWIAGFDIIYACQDIAVDRRDGLHSLPARLGAARALMVSRACHAGTVSMLYALGRLSQMGPLYWAGVAAVALLLIVEQSLVRADDLSRVNVAFFTVNGMVGLVFAAAAIADVLARS